MHPLSPLPWTYVGELAFNLLVLVGAMGCDRIVKEIMGL